MIPLTIYRDNHRIHDFPSVPLTTPLNHHNIIIIIIIIISSGTQLYVKILQPRFPNSASTTITQELSTLQQ
jgi:hypothetical protein